MHLKAASYVLLCSIKITLAAQYASCHSSCPALPATKYAGSSQTCCAAGKYLLNIRIFFLLASNVQVFYQVFSHTSLVVNALLLLVKEMDFLKQTLLLSVVF